jgi:hypothetical protein
MDAPARERTERYISARYHNLSWQLLASRRAPLVLGCLQTLFEQAHDGIALMEFDSLDAVKAFVGADVTVSYVPDKAREVLVHWDSHAQHYEVREQRRY